MDDRALELESYRLLMEGRYAEGWPLYEHRRARLEAKTHSLPVPEWHGEDLTGKCILVYGEQGLGDEIQMVRFVPQLRALGAARVLLGANPLLVRAFAQVGADMVFRSEGTVDIPVPDYWVLIGSLPHRLNVSPNEIPPPPYLTAVPLAGPRIGLVWRGQPRNPHDAYRSLPSPELLGGIPGSFLEPWGDVQDSLDAVSGVDLLITVDTSWAHMAGALGKDCWLMLPDGPGLDWRWMRDRRDSPWYPSLRLYRQPTPGDWASVVADIRQDLGL